MTGSPGPRPARLPRSFFGRSPLEVAPDLLGCTVEHAGVTVRITETEAYAGRDDPGSHAFRGETPRTRVMFGPAGFLYVYFTYGMHFCANVVCGPEGRASAVLLRAGEVVQGVEASPRGAEPTWRLVTGHAARPGSPRRWGWTGRTPTVTSAAPCCAGPRRDLPSTWSSVARPRRSTSPGSETARGSA